MKIYFFMAPYLNACYISNDEYFVYRIQDYDEYIICGKPIYRISYVSVTKQYFIPIVLL